MKIRDYNATRGQVSPFVGFPPSPPPTLHQFNYVELIFVFRDRVNRQSFRVLIYVLSFPASASEPYFLCVFVCV